MRIVEDYIDVQTDLIEIISAVYIGDYSIMFFFMMLFVNWLIINHLSKLHPIF
jgi:hypothetical protein